MKLSAKVGPIITSWMEKMSEKYLRHDTQNEIIRLMTFIILRDIAKNINDNIFYSIMADELADNFWLPISIHPKLVVKQRSYQECSSLIQPLLSIFVKIDEKTVSTHQR